METFGPTNQKCLDYMKVYNSRYAEQWVDRVSLNFSQSCLHHNTSLQTTARSVDYTSVISSVLIVSDIFKRTYNFTLFP